MRNRLAGIFKGKSKSARYFASNPESREKKNEYNKKYHASSKRKKYRSELNRVNRQKGSAVGDGMDMSHGSDGTFTKESQSKNRARNGKGGKPRKR
jgi:hypothetical protein